MTTPVTINHCALQLVLCCRSRRRECHTTISARALRSSSKTASFLPGMSQPTTLTLTEDVFKSLWHPGIGCICFDYMWISEDLLPVPVLFIQFGPFHFICDVLVDHCLDAETVEGGSCGRNAGRFRFTIPGVHVVDIFDNNVTCNKPTRIN